MATHGYSTLMLQAINDANPFLLGVQLAKICVRLNIPVKDVAEYLKVSRPTVYSWFIGRSEVSKKHQEQVEKLIKKLA
jgi:predicted transcriptional regulator